MAFELVQVVMRLRIGAFRLGVPHQGYAWMQPGALFDAFVFTDGHHRIATLAGLAIWGNWPGKFWWTKR